MPSLTRKQQASRWNVDPSMAKLYIALGSNSESESALAEGITALKESFAISKTSSIYQSNAYGFNGAPFHNLVVQATSTYSLKESLAIIHNIENQLNPQNERIPFQSRRLDMDLLLYN